MSILNLIINHNDPRSGMGRLMRGVRALMKRKLEWQTRLQGKAFYCNALSGESNYNVSINSDLTLSCNCSDFDDSGILGDLSKNTLPEVFHGKVATAFRQQLAAGRLPLAKCTRCSDLRTASKEEAARYRDQYDLPRKGIMVENTILCNLKCLGCTQAITAEMRAKKTINLVDLKRISLMLQEHRIERVAYFKSGEPFLSPRLKEELVMIREDNPNLEIWLSTNGMLMNTDRKREAAMLLDEVIVSLDGMDDVTVAKYQVGSSFTKAYQNMCDLVKYRNAQGRRKPTIEWKYVLFNWNDRPEMIQRAIELAREAQVDKVSFWPTTMPWHGISWRYYLGRFFQTIGEPSWKGREIVFSPQAKPA